MFPGNVAIGQDRMEQTAVSKAANMHNYAFAVVRVPIEQPVGANSRSIIFGELLLDDGDWLSQIRWTICTVR